MEKSKLVISLVLILLLPCVTATVLLPGPKSPKPNKQHFVLVHGICHGAWYWYKILALLKDSGHNVTALDLGASGINPKQALETRQLSQYFSPLTEFMASLPAHEKVVLVGHAVGGLAVSKVMESYPNKISVAVFITALMPGPTLNATTLLQANSGIISALDNRVTFDDGPNNPPTTFIFGPKYMATNIYQLSPTQDLALATTLVRPVFLFTAEDVSKEIVLTSQRYGSVKRAFIVAAEDKLFKKEFQQMMIQKNPPGEVEEIRGSDHMVQLSKPYQLFTLLLHIANKFN